MTGGRGLNFCRILLLGLVSALALAGLAGTAQARTPHVKGTVVHVNRGAGSFVVANHKGRLFAIHSQSSPALGSKVAVTVRKLKNGTFAATGTRTGRHSRKVRVHGVVSHAAGDVFTLSGHGVSMLVKVRSGHGAPATGSVVTVTGPVDEENEGEIDEEDLQEEGEDNNALQLEGTILEVDEAGRTLTISSDDNDSAGESVVVHVPAALNIMMFTVGEEVELNVKPLEGGGFELLGSSSDEGEQGAEDEQDEQGEQGEDEQAEGEQDQNEQ